jgi:hypothetical protein
LKYNTIIKNKKQIQHRLFMIRKMNFMNQKELDPKNPADLAIGLDTTQSTRGIMPPFDGDIKIGIVSPWDKDYSERINPGTKPVLVMVESPYSASERYTIEDNVAYAIECMRDSYTRGEAPMLTHLLYTRIPSGHVSDHDPNHKCMDREYGLQCAHEWRKVCSKTVLYTDHGISSGMERAEKEAIDLGQEVERRNLK